MAQGIIGSNNNVNGRGSIGGKADSHSTIGGNFDIYGTVNNPVTILEYYGDISDTATVNVNNTTKHISVDVTKLPCNLVIEDKTLDNTETYIFNGSKDRKIILKDWTLKKVEPKSKSNLLEYSLIKDGNEVGDRICIPKDKFITSIILKFIDEGSLEDVKKQCPEAKIGDPYLDIIVQNVEQGHLENHLFVLMINVVDIYNAGHGLILTKVITEDNRKIMVFSVDPEVIKQDINFEGIHKKIDDEINRATENEDILLENLNKEAKTRKEQDDILINSLDEETNRAKKAEESINTDLHTNYVDLSNEQVISGKKLFRTGNTTDSNVVFYPDGTIFEKKTTINVGNTEKANIVCYQDATVFEKGSTFNEGLASSKEVVGNYTINSSTNEKTLTNKIYVDNLNSTEVSNRTTEDKKLQDQITTNDTDIASLQSTKADLEGANVSLYNIDDSEIDNSVIKTSKISNSRLFNNSLEGIINTGGSTYATIDGLKAELNNWSILNATFGDDVDLQAANVLIDDPTTSKNPVSLNYLQTNYSTKSYVDNEVTTLFDEIIAETARAQKEEQTIQDSLAAEITRANTKESELETAIKETGKIDDVIVNGTSVVTDKVANIDLTDYAKSTDLSKYVLKAGDTMTGALNVPTINTYSTNAKISIATGTNGDSYFQSRKFRGQGDASTYNHAIDFGYAGHDRVDFYEYGGTWNFWQNQSSSKLEGDNNRALTITSTALKNKTYTYSWPNKSGTFVLTSDLDNYALKTDLSNYVKDTITFTGSGALSGGGTLEENRTIIHNTTTRTNTTSTATPSYGETFTAIDSVESDSYGHVSKVNTKTITLPEYSSITVDSILSNTSINPVQNKVINNALENKQNTITSNNKLSTDLITGLSTVATSGSYNDLSNKPTIPTVNNGTLTIQKNGTNVTTFTANQSTNATANITVPTKVSELNNDSGFTSNTGTVTSVAVKMNGSSKGTITSSGEIDLGTVITDISSKQDKLTVGNNININDSNEISATDTTYTIDTTTDNTITLTGSDGSTKTKTINNVSNATTATKLSNTSIIGSSVKPVYFSASGIPVSCTYSVNKDVPSDAIFTDTHYTSYNYVGAANSASNSATTNGNTYLKLYENNSQRSQFKIVGSGLTSVSSDASGNITISTPSSASKGYKFYFSSTYTQEPGYSVSGYWLVTVYYADGTYSSHTVYALGGLNTRTNVTAVCITSYLSGNIGIYSTESSGYVFSTNGIQTASSAIPTSSTVTTSQFILLSDFDATINFEQDA